MTAATGAWCRSLLAVLLLSAWASACNGGDNGSKRDGGPASDAGLFSCKEPNKACNAHDPCVIAAVCGEDHLCHPDLVQNCDDDLDCTTDTCVGPGRCSYEAKEGFCALLIQDPAGGDSVMTCIEDGTGHPSDPCLKCDAKQSSSKWSESVGKTCDDGIDCTKDDVCQVGGCKGTYYGGTCGDLYECTEDICDGQGGCSHTLHEGWCAIENACYEDQEEDISGCFVCDTGLDPYAWTPLPDLCTIGTKCYSDGEQDSSGCGVCDPTKDDSGWSPVPDTCLIDGQCYQSGQQASSGCGVCDPQQSGTSWSPAAGTCRILGTCYPQGTKSPSGCGACDPAVSATAWTPVAGSSTQVIDFEDGTGGLTLDPLSQQVGWQVVTKRAHGGTHSLYYGSTTTWTYNTGSSNQGSATSAAVSLPAGQAAAVQFWLFLDVETADAFDILSVRVDGSAVWTKGMTTVPADSYRRWIFVEVDLSAYAGQTINVSFDFNTVDYWANSSEGVYIDDLVVVTDCG